MTKERISIVIPCYNSESTLKKVVDEIVNVIGDKLDYEVVLVNDGSTEKLWRIIQELVMLYTPIVRGIRFSKNFGQHAALMAGFRAAQGDIIIQMDDDGQLNPRGVFILLDKMQEGYDVVFAKYPEVKENLFRKVGSELNRQMCISFLNMPRNIKPTSFVAIKRYVIDEMIRYEKPYPYIGGLLFRSTSSICNVEIEHRDRVAGRSNYNLKKLVKLWLNGFTAFSVKPLRTAVITGMVIALMGFVFALVILVRKFTGVSVLVGWSSTISAVLIVGGLNLTMLGMLGEYVGRIYICLNNAPQYVIKETCEPKRTDAE